MESSFRTANPRFKLNTQDPGRGGSLLYSSAVDPATVDLDLVYLDSGYGFVYRKGEQKKKLDFHILKCSLEG